ncbi:Transposable element Tc1 transposase [Labeo rohita]|uniref:Transposable element Tc1 transposase n=1 Tax=Labeo rohita TaxID=84645 RepID=A0ABQ8M421_LABRO|nr:Transposable element Tc1 transposase [Labeo rohita]
MGDGIRWHISPAIKICQHQNLLWLHPANHRSPVRAVGLTHLAHNALDTFHKSVLAQASRKDKNTLRFSSLGYTILGKTADLTVVQKTIIDTLHKEGKPQTFIAKEAGCSQSAVSKHVNRKLSGRKKCGRKRCTTNRENRSLERLPLLNHRQHQRRLTWAKEKKKWTVAQWSKVLFSDESKFCISFGNQGPRVWRKGGEAQSPSCLKSSVKFPVSDDLECNVICWCWSTQDLAPAHTAKSTKSRLNDHSVGVLDWPASSPDLNIVKRKMRNKRPKNADELKATVKETWASIPPQQCHRLITSMPRRIEAVIKAKGAPTKY